MRFKQYISLLEMSNQEAETTLGLTGTYTASEVKTAWKKAAMTNHPDKGGSLEKMKAVNVAYDKLKNGGGGSSGKFDWAKSNEKYQRFHDVIIKDFQSRFKPKAFEEYFKKYFNEDFVTDLKYSDTKSYSTYYAWLECKFKNSDSSITFDFRVSVYLSDVVHGGKTLGGDDITYEMSISADGYANSKKQKMSKRNFGYNNSIKVLSTPAMTFPMAKMKKIVKDGQKTGPIKLKRADMMKAMVNEVGAVTFSGGYVIKDQEGNYYFAERGVFMRVPYWRIVPTENNKFHSKTGRLISFSNNIDAYGIIRLPEDSTTLDFFKSIKKSTSSRVISAAKKLKGK